MDVPDVAGRLEILNVHARNKKLDESVNLESVAMRVPGFSGADLANLLNEAAILTGRRNLPSITNKVWTTSCFPCCLLRPFCFASDMT